MNKALKKRVQQVERHFAAAPIPPKIVKAALEHFRATGELPDEIPLAWLVVRRAKAGYDCIYGPGDRFDFAASIRAAIETKPRVEDPLMDSLYVEAILGDGMRREAARLTLRAFASAGLDPSEPLLAGKDMDIPDWGGVGIHFLGLTERLVKAPYEAQAERLFAHYEVLRDRVPQGDHAWFDRLGVAVGDLHERGELPDDELVRDAVLADAELRTLFRHAAGEDVADIMMAFDDLARGPDHDAALKRLLAMAASGRLLVGSVAA